MTIPENNHTEHSEFAATNSDDQAIVMHRDAHFSGSFSLMIDYYENGGKGCSSDFLLERIKELASYEERTKQNLATLLLGGAEAEKIERAKKCYQTLRALYEIEKPQTSLPRLIADLILTESEEPDGEIAEIIAQKGAIVPLLIDLVRSEDLRDPLFPGYGSAPQNGVRCLAAMGDKRSIIALFEEIGRADFFHEDLIIDALYKIGAPAKEFLLRVVQSRPLTEDNERAAVALQPFRSDPEVAAVCYKTITSGETWENLPLTSYLLHCCEALTAPVERSSFAALASNPSFPKELCCDVDLIVQGWDK